MPLGDVAMQYPFPYKTSDGEIQDNAAGDTEPLVVTNTNPATGFINSTGALQVHGGAQIWGDLWVAGNVYVAGAIYESTFRPVVDTYSGVLGNIIYQQNSGSSILAANTFSSVVCLDLVFTYTGSSAASLYIKTLPAVSIATIEQIFGDVVVDGGVGVPIRGRIQPSSSELVLENSTTGAPMTLTGSGTVSITVTLCYLLTSTPVPFTPSLSSSSGTVGTVTYTNRLGFSNDFGAATVCAINMTGTSTGGSFTYLRVNGLPANSIYTSITGGLNTKLEGNITPPLLLKSNAGVNNSYFTKAVDGTRVDGSGITTFGVGTNMLYFKNTATAFTPALFSAIGSLGTVNYTTQTGYTTSSDKGVIYWLLVEGTYTGGTSSKLCVAGLPSTNGLVKAVSKQILTNLNGPLSFIIEPNTALGVLYNDSLETFVTLFGAGSFSIEIIGAYINL